MKFWLRDIFVCGLVFSQCFIVSCSCGADSMNNDELRYKFPVPMLSAIRMVDQYIKQEWGLGIDCFDIEVRREEKNWVIGVCQVRGKGSLIPGAYNGVFEIGLKTKHLSFDQGD